MLKHSKFFPYLFLFFITLDFSAKALPVGKDDDSIVQVKSTVQYPNFIQPWRFKNPETRFSLGVYVGDGLVLTTVQTIHYATSIEIQKFGSLKNFIAKVIKLDSDLGLALLKIEDKEFSSGLKKVHFPGEIFLPSTGIFFEYKENRNLGEKKIRSIKLDVDSYTSGYIELPYIEIQSDEKLEGVGELVIEESSRIAQGMVISFKDSKNTGKMIPSFMIKQFLDCQSEASCISFKGFRFRPLTDKQTRDYYGVKKEDQGVLVAEVYPDSKSKNQLLVEDVILEVAGYKIDPKGMFEHSKYGKIPLAYIFHVNDDTIAKTEGKLSLKILRNKKLIVKDLEIKPLDETAIKIPFGSTRNRKPEYLILGGIVFQELSEQYLMEFGNQWRSRVSKELLFLNDYYHIAKNTLNEKYIIVTQVFPLTGNQTYHSLHQIVLEKLNGKTARNLRELKKIMDEEKQEFLVFEFNDGSQAVFKREEIGKLNQEAMKTFSIPTSENF